MILLTSTSDKIQLITSAAANIDVHASWADGTTTAFTPDRKNTAISSATTTDIVLAPAASTQRQIKTLIVRNKHATDSNTVTVRHTDGTTVSELFKCTLLAGEHLQYVDGEGFSVFNSSGSKKITSTAAGAYIQTQRLASGTSFTVSASTRKIRYRMVGAGGGGAGADTAAVSASGGSGGGTGAYAEGEFDVTPGASYSYAIGALGTGGAAGANGSNGGSTTLTVGATTVTCPGGTGGIIMTPGTNAAVNRGGLRGALATNGGFNTPGNAGGMGFRFDGTNALGGHGGISPLGAGAGQETGTPGVGNAAHPNSAGSGGGGALVENGSAAVAGGDGAPGLIIIDEYS
jgi:hypothetical protein